jgi:RNA polymerase sigma-70 factor (ECF subfamily)
MLVIINILSGINIVNVKSKLKLTNMNETYTPESQLIENCIKGQRSSQKALYDMYSAKMFAICLRYSKNQMDAEDILQEGFVKLFNNLVRFRGDGSFDGWVRRIFVNTAIEHIRRKSLTTTVGEGLENTVPDRQHNALDKLYEKDLINTSLKLSDGYRTVFNLYAIDGYSHKEIATKLGITESTSKSQFSRAKALLRNMIQNKSKKNTSIEI